MNTRLKLLFVVTEDWYFVSHRLPLAMAVQKAGLDVALATRVGKYGETIRAAGIRLIPFAGCETVFHLVARVHAEADRRREFSDFMQELRRVLPPDGVCSHRVDLKDHLGRCVE